MPQFNMVFLSNGLWKRKITKRKTFAFPKDLGICKKKFLCPLLISIRCHMEKFWDSFLVADDESYASKDVIPFFSISLLSLLYHPILSFSFTKFLLHAIQEEESNNITNRKNTRRRNGKKEKEIMLWGRRRVRGLLVLLVCFSMLGNSGSHPCSQASRNAKKDLKTRSLLPWYKVMWKV